MTRAMDNRTTLRTSDFELNIVTRGEVDPDAEEQAAAEIEKLADRAPRPVIFARVKLTYDRDRAPDEQCLAQATIDMSGTLLRAQVAASSMRDAIDAVAERLTRNLRRIIGRRQALRIRPPQTPEGSWRSGDLPTQRPSYHPRDPEEREVVRRKSFAPEDTTPEEALFDMEALDHRFFLFTLAESSEDAIVYETENGYGLRLVSGGEPDLDTTVDFTVNPAPPPALGVDEAKELLDNTSEGFVFFRDPEDDRGRILYRRYDGHYGLIEPRA